MLGRLYSDEEWEALCNRCGECCYESRWTGDGWEKTNIPCRMLDEETMLCRAYGDRFAVEDDCMRVTPSVVLSGMMPASCSYHDELHAVVEQEHGGDDPRPRRRRGRRNWR